MQYKNSKLWIKSNFQSSTLHEAELASTVPSGLYSHRKQGTCGPSHLKCLETKNHWIMGRNMERSFRFPSPPTQSKVNESRLLRNYFCSVSNTSKKGHSTTSSLAISCSILLSYFVSYNFPHSILCPFLLMLFLWISKMSLTYKLLVW